jgi:hypothetical protein
VTVLTDLNITGKPAQFGRGVMLDVGNKLIGQFADCLAGKLAASEAAEPSETAPAPAPAAAEGASASVAGGGSNAEPEPAGGSAPEPTEQPTPAAAEIAAGQQAAAETSAPAPAAVLDAPAGIAAGPGSVNGTQARGSHAAPVHEVEPIDLLGSAGPAVLKRLAVPVLALAALLLVVVRLRRRS